MAKAHQLTDSQVRAFKPRNTDRWENDGNGLYIRIRPNGKKTWVLRRKIQGTTKKSTLGQYPELTLRHARLEAAQERIRDRDLAKLSPALAIGPGTFGELLQKYYSEHIEPNYRRPRQVRMYIDNRVPESINALTISELDSLATREFRVAIRDWLYEYANSSGPVGANRLLAIFKQATKFGTAIGHLTVDPLRELTRKLVGGTEKSGDRTLSKVEIKRLWSTESPHTPLLKFLLLTGQRIGEAQLAQWSDIQDNKWHISAEHSKNKKAHWVPITAEILELLDALPHNRKKIFATRSTTGTQAWLKRWCEREKIDPRFTPHDLRRTFVTELNELGIEPFVIEKLVNHSMSGVMATYNRAGYEAERVAAAQVWSEYILAVVSRD